MEDYNKRKRVPDDSEADSPESKNPRVHSGGSESDGYELARVESDNSLLDSSGVSEIQGDLLNILDDTDGLADRDPTMQDLDSVMKSFQEEMCALCPDGVDPNTAHGTGELEPNLGYLLEASDDELGLPPAVTPSEDGEPKIIDSGRVVPEGVDLAGFLGFDDDIHNYEAFGFGNGLLVGYDADGNGGGGYVTIDGLFDYGETTDNLWRSESLQAM